MTCGFLSAEASLAVLQGKPKEGEKIEAWLYLWTLHIQKFVRIEKTSENNLNNH